MSADAVGLPRAAGEPRRSGAFALGETLRAEIEDGRLAPGSRLPGERRLAERAGVSRITVREALRILESTGLIEIREREGCFVVEAERRREREWERWGDVYLSEARDLVLVRGALDELAAGIAARQASTLGLERIVAAESKFAEAVDQGPPELLARLDIDFHVAIAEAVEGELLPSLLRSLHEHLADSRAFSFTHLGRARESALEHRRIVAAIGDGDAGAAEKATAAHIARVRELLRAGAFGEGFDEER